MPLKPFLIDFFCLISMVCVGHGEKTFMCSELQDRLNNEPDAAGEEEVENNKDG